MTVSAFEIAVHEDEVADLRQRLARTRWPDAAPGGGWAQGTEVGFLRELVHRWASSYDWRAHERELNAAPNFTADVLGRRVHFVHRRGRGPDPMPLLLAHGCYSNFYEFHEVAEALADPEAFGGDARDAFDVVVWSLPGFGFSDRPTEPGCNIAAMAGIAHELMTGVLGYPRFGVAGGSWGGLVASCLAFTRPESLSGILLTQATPPAAPVVAPGDSPLTAAERAFAAALQAHRGAETGYAEILRTRPQSLAYALNDSPAGLAGWVVEKLRAWSDCGGELGSTFSLEEILTSISITWFTSTAASGHRLYYENARVDWAPRVGQRATVPTGVLAMPGGIPHEQVPPETVRRWFDLTYYRRAERGGHYPAMETPDVFVSSVRDFFRPLRSSSAVVRSSGPMRSEQ
jgi:pimeloyl-ACP methyl ester carboxylesterase